MEPIDYLGALRRSWRLLIALGILGAVVAVLIPVSPKAAKGSLTGFKWSAIDDRRRLAGRCAGGARRRRDQHAGRVLRRQHGGSPAPHCSAFGVSATPADDGAPALCETRRSRHQARCADVAGGPHRPGEHSLCRDHPRHDLREAARRLPRQPGLPEADERSARTPNVTTQSIGYQVINPPSPVQNRAVKKSSITSSKKVRGLVGLAVGLLLGALIVLVRELLDKRIRSRERAESTFGYPVIAEIPGDAKSHEQAAPRPRRGRRARVGRCRGVPDAPDVGALRTARAEGRPVDRHRRPARERNGDGPRKPRPHRRQREEHPVPERRAQSTRPRAHRPRGWASARSCSSSPPAPSLHAHRSPRTSPRSTPKRVNGRSSSARPSSAPAGRACRLVPSPVRSGPRTSSRDSNPRGSRTSSVFR